MTATQWFEASMLVTLIAVLVILIEVWRKV